MPSPRKKSEPDGLKALLLTSLDNAQRRTEPLSREEAWRAQDHVYDAMEARTPVVRSKVLREVLGLDPGNADALTMLSEIVPLSTEERVDVLRRIVAIAAAALGAEVFTELVPHFWGVQETRPYMRARARLAEVLLYAGRLEESAAEYSTMLQLNANDNLGLRYALFLNFLALGRRADAQKMLREYKDEISWSVAFAWGRVLERLLAGRPADAKKALTAARRQNVFIEDYLLGRRPLPEWIPGSYEIGSEDEALCFAPMLIMAWSAHPETLVWLREQNIHTDEA